MFNLPLAMSLPESMARLHPHLSSSIRKGMRCGAWSAAWMLRKYVNRFRNEIYLGMKSVKYEQELLCQ